MEDAVAGEDGPVAVICERTMIWCLSWWRNWPDMEQRLNKTCVGPSIDACFVLIQCIP
jgi:hypothetical protein